MTDFSQDYSVDLVLPKHDIPTKIKCLFEAGCEIVVGRSKNFQRVPVKNEYSRYILEKRRRATAFVSFEINKTFHSRYRKNSLKKIFCLGQEMSGNI